MITQITALPIANASLLDEGTAASEAMLMLYRKNKSEKTQFLVDRECFQQTIDVIISRAEPLNIEIIVTDFNNFDFTNAFGCIVQYPNKYGHISSDNDYKRVVSDAHNSNCKVIFASDLMCLQLFEAPGSLGADIAVGNSQRFGVPLGYGGPHAAFMSTSEEFKRDIPGRIVGVSQDRRGNQAYRLTLQTREQHIRREKATSNICTAQVLLAIISGMYALFHGPDDLKNIARRIHSHTKELADKIAKLGHEIVTNDNSFFDTIVIKLSNMSIDSLKDSLEPFQILYVESVHHESINTKFELACGHKKSSNLDLNVQLLGSGPILNEVIAAARLLKDDWGIGTDVWSVTSYSELHKDAEEVNRWNLLNPEKTNKTSYLDECLINKNGPVIACSDYVKLVAEQISPYVNCNFTSIGTDGFGRSGTRDELRDFLEIDKFHIALAAMNSLYKQGKIKVKMVSELINKYKIDSNKINPLKR